MSDHPTEPPSDPTPRPSSKNLASMLTYYESTGQEICPNCGSGNVEATTLRSSDRMQSPMGVGAVLLIIAVLFATCITPLAIALGVVGLAFFIAGAFVPRSRKLTHCHCNHCGADWERGRQGLNPGS